jgi:hypothetical protein
VRFYDPDGIAWELFASCERTSAQSERPPAAM